MKVVKAWILTVAVLTLFGCGDQGGDPSHTQAGADEPSTVADASSPVADGSSPVADGSSPVADGSVHPGKEIYENYCYSCHLTGLSGAPILGDTQGWAPRIAKGSDLLLQSTIEGMGTIMPARGMCFDCSDEDLAAAVDYMVVNSQ